MTYRMWLLFISTYSRVVFLQTQIINLSAFSQIMIFPINKVNNIYKTLFSQYKNDVWNAV